MRKLDKLIIKEISGPWIFGVAMFTALLFAGTYLGRVTDYISKGVPADLVGKIAIFMLPAILVQTFPMAVLLASLLSFGRLSSDSEIVAVRAAGVSLFRIIAPVSVFSLLVAVVAFMTNETVVPYTAKQFNSLTDEIGRSLDKAGFKARAVSYPIYDNETKKLTGMIVAKDFVPSLGVLRGATVIGYETKGPNEGKPSMYLYATELEFDANKIRSKGWKGNGWRIKRGAVLTRADGSQVTEIKDEAWPPEIAEPAVTPADLLAQGLKSFETQSMAELRQTIDKSRDLDTLSPKELRNYEYGYWNKIALPLAALIFGTLGAALGIRNHRTGTAAGFALAIAIIFGYFTIANFMNVWAQNGAFPPFVASFTPIAIGLICSAIIIWRRNA